MIAGVSFDMWLRCTMAPPCMGVGCRVSEALAAVTLNSTRPFTWFMSVLLPPLFLHIRPVSHVKQPRNDESGALTGTHGSCSSLGCA